MTSRVSVVVPFTPHGPVAGLPTTVRVTAPPRGRSRIGREVALGRLIVLKVIGRNEVVVRPSRRSNIETRGLSQCGKKRLIGRGKCAGLLTALIDVISRQIRFTVGVPRQCGTPRSTRPQHKHTNNGSHPIHIDTPIASSPEAGTPIPEKPTSQVQVPLSDCRTDSVTRGEIEEGNGSPLHC